MTSIIHNIEERTYCFVTVPEIADRFTVFNDEQPYLSYFLKHDTERAYLPSGNWRLLSRADLLTEEQKSTIVEKDPMLKECFLDYCERQIIRFTAAESFTSLLKSFSLTPSTTIVLEQIKE